MAMTKKEREHLESLERQLRLAKALRFTAEIIADVKIPEGYGDKLSRGFLFNSHGSKRVEPSCSSAMHHCFGHDDKTTTQGAKRLYSTELLAWKAMRNEVEKRVAAELAWIDAKIEELTKGHSCGTISGGN